MLAEHYPKTLNRVDDLIVFDRLSHSELGQIVAIQFDRLRRRVGERRIDIDLTDAASSWLVDHGYDPVFGARPLKRLIQTEIGDRLALEILQGAYLDGDTVVVDAVEDELVIGV